MVIISTENKKFTHKGYNILLVNVTINYYGNHKIKYKKWKNKGKTLTKK